MKKIAILIIIVLFLITGGFFWWQNKNHLKLNFFRAQVSSSLERPQEEINEPEPEEEINNKLKTNLAEALERVNNLSEELDDLSERIDVLSQRIAEIEAKPQAVSEEISETEKLKEIIEEKEDKEKIEQEKLEQEELEQEEAGQESPILCEKIPESNPNSNKVIINEVSWMGATNSANDEWIELKNISNEEINLADWQLLDKDNQIKIIFTDRDRVSVNGFYLLERTDDDSVPNVSADFIYIGALGNTNEALYLFDENCQLQDEVKAFSDWPAGDNGSKRTMERKSNLEWQTSSDSGGTPKRENSAGYFEYYSGGGGGGGGGFSPSPQPILEVSPKNLEFTVIEFSTPPQEGVFSITNIGSGDLEWTGNIEYLSPSIDGIINYTSPPIEGLKWLELNPDFGIAPSEISVSTKNTSNLIAGVYLAKIIINAEKTEESPQEVEVSLSVEEFVPEEELPQTVVINEIAWMGNETSSADEWIELYNNSGQDINLFGWQLKSSDGGPDIVFDLPPIASATISADGFYLLERTDDNSAPNVSVDFIYSGALENDGEELNLYDSFDNLIDKVDCSSGWFAGDNNTKQTMERKNPENSGNNPANWGTSQESEGTPRAQNSVFLL